MVSYIQLTFCLSLFLTHTCLFLSLVTLGSEVPVGGGGARTTGSIIGGTGLTSTIGGTGLTSYQGSPGNEDDDTGEDKKKDWDSKKVTSMDTNHLREGGW